MLAREQFFIKLHLQCAKTAIIIKYEFHLCASIHFDYIDSNYL